MNIRYKKYRKQNINKNSLSFLNHLLKTVFKSNVSLDQGNISYTININLTLKYLKHYFTNCAF
jgi:hypothetical protein